MKRPGILARLAWRDSRRSRKRLMLCAAAIIFGVAALTAIDGFRANLSAAIDARSKELLGADLAIISMSPFSERVEAFIDKLGAEDSREVRFTSMALFPEQDRTRLVEVRGLSGGFPFYGEIETGPPGLSLEGHDEPVALVEDSLMIGYGLEPGDTVRLGETGFRILGALEQVPGEAAFAGIFAPRIYVPRRHVAGTGLVQFGSLVRYRALLRLPGGPLSGDELRERAGELFTSEALTWDTVERRKRQIGRVLENVYGFLNLVGLVALLLGGVGVAGAVNVYLREKREAVAVLRCLGLSSRAAFSVFLLQILGVAVAGAVLGVLAGLLVQTQLPAVLGRVIPYELDVFISWPAVARGLGIGAGVAFLFALLPLLPVRRVSPLRALRSEVEPPRGPDVLAWLVGGLIALACAGLCILQAGGVRQGLVFAAALAAVLGVLAGLAWLLRRALRLLSGDGLPFVYRQGFSNLYRPNNRTLFLVTTLGAGAFMIYGLYLVQASLLSQGDLAERGDEPNLMLFDVQPDQLEPIRELLRQRDAPVAYQAPIVTMRLTHVNGRSAAEIKADPQASTEDWTLNREWRSTYRDHLIETEEVVQGRFTGHYEKGLEGTVPIALDIDVADDAGVELGDTLTFNVQGIPVETKVTAFREIDWQRMRPNTLALFPTGVLEPAPAWHILFARADSDQTSAAIQREIANRFSNVSAIDLDLIVETIRDIFDRIVFVIRFMATFTIATGVVVLAGAVVTSRYQRLRESVLLRTLGATARQVRGIMATEYCLLGVLGGLAGCLLAVAAAWGLTTHLFESPFVFPPFSFPAAVAITAVLTVLTGLVNSRGIVNAPPLAVLRRDA